MFVNGGVEGGAEAVGGGPEFLVEVLEELLLRHEYSRF